MSGLKIIKISSDKYLFFHGESLSLFVVDKANSPEIFNQVHKVNNTFVIELDDDLKEHFARLKSNKYYISEGGSSLDTIVLPISAGCNLSCPYCFAKVTEGDFKYSDYKERDIDNILDFVKKNSNASEVKTIVFFGGEPLINFRIIQYTINLVEKQYSNLNIRFSITTNGTLITPSIARYLKDKNVALLISLDGYDNEYNFRKFKNGKASVNRVLKAIDICKNTGVEFEIRATITSINPYIYETYMFLENLHVPYSVAFAYTSQNRSHSDLTSYGIRDLDRIKIAFNHLFKYYKKCLLQGNNIYNKLVWQFYNDIKNRISRNLVCMAGRTYITIMSNGNIYTCAHLMNEKECAIGNIKQWPLKDISTKNFVPVAIESISECNDCWALYLCYGGCPSQKFSMGRRANQAFLPEKCQLDKLQYELLIKVCYELIEQKYIS